MKIAISQQILTGNINEGFQLAPYLDALKPIYEETISGRYPHAEIEIDFDVQGNSGYTREMSINVYDDSGEWVSDGGDLAKWLENDAEKLADDERWYD